MTDEGFDLPRLLHEDSFEAIKILFNHKKYISAAKLLVSFVDMIAYLEFDDTAENFQRWLDCYADLIQLGVSSAELWEFRNSLIHMTNLNSRKVLAGKVKRLMFYVGRLPTGFPTEDQEAKFFDLFGLIVVVAKATEKWISSLNSNRSKSQGFLARYDHVLSDTRYALFSVKQ